MPLTFGSLFAGIGGFDIGFESAGMDCKFQVEIDGKANAVRRKHWPDVSHHEDVKEFHAENSIRPDIICGGFPCQDLSVAGRRAGLAGERSGLFYEFMRVVAEFGPGWVCIENVPGLLSSNGGRDMGAVLGTLGQLGYRWAYRVLDAQYFGVAQRRRRVFIVANTGNRPHPAEILFDSESLSRNPPTRGKAGKRVADCLTAGVASSRGVNRPGRRREDDSNIVTALSANGVGTCGADDNQAQGGHLVSYTIHGTDKTAKVASETEVAGSIRTKAPGSQENSSTTVVAHTLRAEGHDASEDGTGRGTPIVAFAQNQRGELRESEIAPQLTCGGGKPGEGFPAARMGQGVRRLTPRECERLQGFPDDFTRWDADGNEISDSARYRMLGNAVAVPVSAWIGRRIVELLN